MGPGCKNQSQAAAAAGEGHTHTGEGSKWAVVAHASRGKWAAAAAGWQQQQQWQQPPLVSNHLPSPPLLQPFGYLAKCTAMSIDMCALLSQGYNGVSVGLEGMNPWVPQIPQVQCTWVRVQFRKSVPVVYPCQTLHINTQY